MLFCDGEMKGTGRLGLDERRRQNEKVEVRLVRKVWREAWGCDGMRE